MKTSALLALFVMLSVLCRAQNKSSANESPKPPDAKPIVLTKAETDTPFSRHSGIDTILINTRQIENLQLLGQVWGFIKYYHPAVAKGDFNMDAELFRILPAVLKVKSNSELSATLEWWLGKFGVVDTCTTCKPVSDTAVYQQADYGSIFDKKILSPSLIKKLSFILNNDKIEDNYYIQFADGIGNVLFTHELPYTAMTYPDAGYRLLSLFRYWNMIQYFFPYKHLFTQNWNNILTEYLPKFINARNETDYAVAALGIISNIHDTHANVYRNNAIEAWRGKYRLPFEAKFVEDKLVVTGYYVDTLKVKDVFKLGDIITSVNNVPVELLVKKFLPITAASNYPTQLRDLPRHYLLRSNKPSFTLQIMRNGKSSTVIFNGINSTKPEFTNTDFQMNQPRPGYYLINSQIGYVFPGQYKNDDLPAIEKLFANTKGIIVDMRCYPASFMPYTFVPYVKTGNNKFVKFAFTSTDRPGLFNYGPTVGPDGTGIYKGKVVVIVNSVTQSQAEFTTMAFQSSPNVTVIGSTTAGADGNISKIVLPGGIISYISGMGILYPDGTESQRKGVKIDIVITPTIAGIKAGRDELLEKAEEIINNSER